MTPKHFFLELYNINFYFFVGWQPRAFLEYIDLNFNVEDDLSDWDRGATLFSEEHRAVFLWVRAEHDMAATLVHESVHAACFALDWAGVYVDLKEDEALAYLAELVYLKAAPEIVVECKH
jgi:hypothetical protein